MNVYERVFPITTRSETWLESEFGAVGRGLHEKVSSVEALLPKEVIQAFRLVATVRNELAHEGPEAIQIDAQFERAEHVIEEFIERVERREYDMPEVEPLAEEEQESPGNEGLGARLRRLILDIVRETVRTFVSSVAREGRAGYRPATGQTTIRSEIRVEAGVGGAPLVRRRPRPVNPLAMAVVIGLLVSAGGLFACLWVQAVVSLLLPGSRRQPRVQTSHRSRVKRPKAPSVPGVRRLTKESWHFEPSTKILSGVVRNVGSIGCTGVTPKVFYLDSDGKVCGAHEMFLAETVVPGQALHFEVHDTQAPSIATRTVRVSLKREIDDVRPIQDDAGVNGNKVSVRLLSIRRESDASFFVKVEFRNRGLTNLAGLRTNIEFLRKNGKPVQSWLFDTFAIGAAPSYEHPKNWWWDSPELPLRSGYVTPAELRLKGGGPPGWGESVATTKMQVLAAWFVPG